MGKPVSEKTIIGVVGPCGSGKTTLIKNLHGINLQAHHIAQEHSYVQDMWKRITNPATLIFLDASFSTATLRRHLNWTLEEYEEQQRRLAHARHHADLLVETDSLSPEQVFQKVKEFLFLSEKTSDS